MGKPLLKVAVNFISLPRTSVAVTGMVFVRITGDADSLRTAEFKAIPNAAASRPCANPLYLIILPKFSGGEKGTQLLHRPSLEEDGHHSLYPNAVMTSSPKQGRV